MADAYRKGDPKRIIEHTDAYGLAMGELGEECGAAKPSGVGGGDAAIAVFENAEQARALRSSCIRFNLPPLDLSFQAPGLLRD